MTVGLNKNKILEGFAVVGTVTVMATVMGAMGIATVAIALMVKGMAAMATATAAVAAIVTAMAAAMAETTAAVAATKTTALTAIGRGNRQQSTNWG